jgi:uncharacterized membrane protein YcaP (DUF421 family)
VLHDLFHLDISVWDKAIRTVAVYGALLLLLRLAGKRQLGQFNTFDLVVLLLLSNVVQNAVIGPDDSLLGGLIGAAVLLAANFAFVLLGMRLPWLQGRETMLVRDGTVDDRALKRELITRSELERSLRRQGYGGLDQVTSVRLEPEGTLDVERKEDPILVRIERRLEAIERKLELR